MKRAIIGILILLLVLPLAAQAVSLSDIGDKPAPAPRTMPEPTVTFIPQYSSDSGQFLGRIDLTDKITGLGYAFDGFPADPWGQMQALIRYDNRLIASGYKAPSFDKFEGDSQRYLRFSANDKPSVYLLPYLKEGALIAVVRYDNSLLDAFPEDVSAGEAWAALAGELDGAETMEAASGKLAALWKTPEMKKTVTDKVTAQNMDALLPTLIRRDFFTRFSDGGEVDVPLSVSEVGGVVRSLIDSGETAECRLSMAKRVAETIVPAVDERYLEVTALVENTAHMATDEVTEALPAIPAFDPEAAAPQDLHDDGAQHRYVIVSEKDGAYRLLPYHAAFLPADCIAESIAEADRIIVCHNYYKKSSGNWIGGTPNDSITRINLYGGDGALIATLGAAGNYQGSVSHGGLPHDWMEMGEVIRGYFAEN